MYEAGLAGYLKEIWVAILTGTNATIQWTVNDADGPKANTELIKNNEEVQDKGDNFEKGRLFYAYDSAQQILDQSISEELAGMDGSLWHRFLNSGFLLRTPGWRSMSKFEVLLALNEAKVDLCQRELNDLKKLLIQAD